MADSKVTALTETTTPTTTDLLYVVTTPGGTPASKKATLDNVRIGMGVGMVKLAETVLVGTAANFDFTSISGSYRHLKIFVQARSDTAAVTSQDVHIHFNNDGTGTYDAQVLAGDVTTASASKVAASASNYVGQIPAANATANNAGSIEITIPNYSGATFYKNFIGLSGYFHGTADTTGHTRICTGQWRNTAAITRVTILPTADNFIAGSVATLYGLS